MVESVNTKYKAAISETCTIAKTQAALVRHVKHLYEDIVALCPQDDNSSQASGSSRSSSSRCRIDRLESRARDLQKDIAGMSSMQHECALKFELLGEQFTYVRRRSLYAARMLVND